MSEFPHVYNAWHSIGNDDYFVGKFNTREEAEAALRELPDFMNVENGAVIAGQIWKWKNEDHYFTIEMDIA